jgi:hypothetical protein
MAENDPNEAAAALGIDAYGGDPNVDPMGLGGVGGGWFGGDPSGSGGSKLTGLGVKDGVETTPKEEQEYWDSFRNVVLAAPAQPLRIKSQSAWHLW